MSDELRNRLGLVRAQRHVKMHGGILDHMHFVGRAFKQLIGAAGEITSKQNRGCQHAPVPKAISQSPAPLSQARFSSVDLLSAPYEGYDRRPSGMPIHNVEHDLRLRAVTLELPQ